MQYKKYNIYRLNYIDNAEYDYYTSYHFQLFRHNVCNEFNTCVIYIVYILLQVLTDQIKEKISQVDDLPIKRLTLKKQKPVSFKQYEPQFDDVWVIKCELYWRFHHENQLRNNDN